MKKLAFLILALPCLHSSAQTSDRLLWYKGKKQNDTTLITVAGSTVIYRKKTSEVEVKQKSDPFSQMTNEIKKTEERKKEMVTGMARHKQGVILYSYATQVLDTYDKIAQDYTQVIAPKISLPSASSFPVANSHFDPLLLVSRGPFNLFTEEMEIPQWVKNNHADVLRWVSLNRDKKEFEFPQPPEMNIACYGCNKELSAEYDQNSMKYRMDLLKEEREIMEKAMAVVVYAEKLTSKQEIQPLLNELYPAQIFIGEYIVKKTTALAKKWGGDIRYLSLIVKALLSAERQNQLIGGKDTYAQTMELVESLINKDVLAKLFKKALDEHDYPIILNMANWIGLERQRQLIGSDEDNSGVVEMETVLQYNRFKFNHTYDVKWKGDCCQIRTVLEANEIFLVAVPDSACNYIFLPENGNRTSLLTSDRLLMTVKEASRPDGRYIGPDKYSSTYPVIRTDFCNETAEIKLMPKLTTNESQIEEWTDPPKGYEGPGGQDIKVTMERSFPWTDKTNELSTARSGRILKLGEPAVVDLNSMENAYKDAKAVADFEEYPFFLEIELTNRSAVLFNDSLDGKEGNDAKDGGDGWEDIEWSWVRVRLEHAPKLKQ